MDFSFFYFFEIVDYYALVIFYFFSYYIASAVFADADDYDLQRHILLFILYEDDRLEDYEDDLDSVDCPEVDLYCFVI